MTNLKAQFKEKDLLDFITLIVFLILVSILTNTIFDLATSIDKGTYSTSIVDLKFPLNK
ncbi:MAG TPA: hypothetical protein VGA80_03235 [Flavobacteriaceae bacterium]|jgi:hypothetical protein